VCTTGKGDQDLTSLSLIFENSSCFFYCITSINHRIVVFICICNVDGRC